MRIALIADTHGHLDERIADAVHGADVLVHAGDVGAGVVEAMHGLADRLLIVQGNNDPADSGWPVSESLDLPGGRLVVIHGDQWPAKNRHRKLRERFPEARAIVCGHSHRRLVDRQVEPWILNPGAAGRRRAYGGPGWIVLNAAPECWHCEAYGYEPRRRRLRAPRPQ